MLTLSLTGERADIIIEKDRLHDDLRKANVRYEET